MVTSAIYYFNNTSFTEALIILFTLIISSQSVYAEPEIMAGSFILMDETSGRVLYSKNENKRMYPASMTKILTSMLVLDYFAPQEIITIGDEINNIPSDSSIAGHKIGEDLSVENLVRGLIIPSGNETGCVAVKAVMQRITGSSQLDYAEAEKRFAQLMNEKARQLGALNSNFINPHGYHNEMHYSTAYDIAVISKAALQYDLIRSVAAERGFEGNGAPLTEKSNPRFYSWKSHNLLLVDGEYFYPYARGIKTGFTDDAGYCLSAYAVKDNKKLISVVMFSTDNYRWTDSISLFDYGFENFDYRSVQEDGVVIGEVELSREKLGTANTVPVAVKGSFSDFFSQKELDSIRREITYLDEFKEADEKILKDEKIRNDDFLIMAPIEEGQVIGMVTYTFNDQVIFEAEAYVTEGAEARDLKSDALYYLEQFLLVAFTKKAVPFWIVAVALITLLIIRIRSNRNKKQRSMYYYKKR